MTIKPLQWLRRSVGYLKEASYYLDYKISDKTYSDYYAERMNRIVTKNPDWGLNLDKTFQLQYLIDHGLTRNSKLLDYGCGALAAGVLFIDYLAPGRYTGVDISEKTLTEGEKRINNRGLENKNAQLFHLASTTLADLKPKTFDVMWAQSVFTHMPPEDIRSLLPSLRSLMHSESTFYASFAFNTASEDTTLSKQRRFKDWYYTEAFFQEAAAASDLDVNIMDDWSHPDDPDNCDRLLRFVPKTPGPVA